MCRLFHRNDRGGQMPQETRRDIDSEIDWKIIDQLHNAVLNFSHNSMQAKKIMFAILGVLFAAMFRVETPRSCLKWFPFVIVLVVLFWAFDAYTYYYQEKLRADMDVRFRSLKKRCHSADSNDEYTLPDSRGTCGRLWRSIFNLSVLLFYPTIIIMIVVLGILISKGIIV